LAKDDANPFQIDWNKVASDLEISNGHAARMRYSRFKSQIDPPSARTIKRKNAKKGGKGDLKGDIQASQAMQHQSFSESGLVPKLEPTGSTFQPNSKPFVKYEPGTPNVYGIQGPSNSQDSFYSPFSHAMSPAPNMPSPQMMPARYLENFDPISHGPQHQYLASGMSMTLPSGTYAPVPMSTPSGFTTYPSFPLAHDINMPDFPSPTPGFNSGPVITWEPVLQQQSESPTSPVGTKEDAPPPARIKQEPESGEKTTETVEIKMEQGSTNKICIS
jgi:hypothetical protein